MTKTVLILAALAGTFGLAGCGDGASAVETRERAAVSSEVLMTATTAGTAANGATAPAEAPGPITANRRETVDEKIQRLYERNGADFDARSPEEFLTKVVAFTRTPPADTDRATRPNGDTLLYQASTNTFAVVAEDGTARTMFKPDDGPSYWAEQKAAAPTFGQRRASN
jgi:pyocin large subunit-like protein